MIEKIGVTYLHVQGATFHMALFYENSVGVKRVIEASPQFNIGQISGASAVGELVKEYFRPTNTNDGSPFGVIVGGERAWSDAAPINDGARPAEVLLTGDNLAGIWGGLVADAVASFAVNYEYRPLQQNSNTFITTLLADVGLPQPTRQILPGSGMLGQYSTPAYQYRLHDPLGGFNPGPQSLGPTNFRFSDASSNQTEVIVGDSAHITVQWANGAVTVTADGTNIAELVDIPVDGTINPASITGVQGHVVLVGSSGADTFDAGGADSLMLGGAGDDTFSLGYGGPNWVDGGSGRDTVNYRHASAGIQLNVNGIEDATTGGARLELTSTEGIAGRLVGIEKIELTEGDDTIILKGSNAQSLQEVDLGAGNDTIDSSVAGLTIDLGTGNNTVKATGPGTIVKSGGGANKVEASHNGQLLFQNASTADHITYYGSTLTGGVHWGGSESVYAYGIHGERYGRNQQGDLVILDANGNQTFIPRFNFGTDGTNRTAGLYVIDVHFEIRSGNIWTTGFEAAAIMLQSLKKIGAALHGWQLHGTDPLVLDLDGNGIPLTGRESSGVVFDINNNQFATPVGWVDSNDGILARDLNGNGKIDDDSEMFGGPQAAGFAQLATLDGNHDGKVDASDNGLADFNGDGVVDASDTFDSLKVWVDANQDGVTDAGELHALADYNIVSIAVGSTPSTLTDSGNDIIATGTFQRADGTTGMVGEVQLDTDNNNTRWTGDSSVSADAASRPDLKGFGTLTDLHVAMTLDPGLIGVVDAASPGLNSLSLASLRAAVRPVLRRDSDSGGHAGHRADRGFRFRRRHHREGRDRL